ncbi:MAG: pyridoxamine 5'-phosphate oxidase family protein [Candidatus Saccharimonadales bacterium]
MKGVDNKLQKRAYQFMLDNRTAALASSGKKGIPHVATIYFLPKKDMTLYFTTRAEGRKFTNMLNNPIVSMAINSDDSGGMVTIQLTGKVERIEDLKEEQDITLELWSLRYDEASWPPPPLRLYERGHADSLAVMKVTPTEMTMANFEVSDDNRYIPFFQKIV